MTKKDKRVNGEGSFAVLPNGKIQMRKMFGYLPNGRPKILTVSGTSQSDCIRQMNTKIASMQSSGKAVDSHTIMKFTLEQLCYRHLQEHLDQRGRLKPKAADRRESTIKNQIAPYSIGQLQIMSVTSQDISRHMEYLINKGNLSVSSVEKAFNVINSAYKYAQSQHFIDYNPCDQIGDRIKNRFRNLKTRDSSAGVVLVLSSDQKQILENYVEELDRDDVEQYRRIIGLGVLLLLYTGMRVGELCALRWRSLARDEPVLTIDKTRNVVKNRYKKEGEATYIAHENPVKNYHSRSIVLSTKAYKVINRIREISNKTADDDYIIINRSSNPTNPTRFDAMINKIYREAGLPDNITGAHILRRTRATDMHNAGARLEDIGSYLGDTPETILKHYISVTKKIVADGKVLNVVKLPVDID